MLLPLPSRRPWWALAAPLAILASLWSQAAFAGPKPGGPSPSATLASQVRSADGVELAVAQSGDRTKPGILFLHGFGQSHLSFRRQFDSALAEQFHLVAFDLRGHGASAKPTDPAAYSDVARSADDVAAVIRATGLVRPVIVAWSYGGVVAGDYIRKYGTANIAGLVLAGTLGGFTKATGPLPDSLAKVAQQMRAASEQSRSTDLAANIAAARTISDAYATAETAAEDRQILFATELMLPAYARRAMLLRPTDNSDIAGQLHGLPLLLVRGESEMGMPEAGIADLKQALPQLALSRFSGGHLTFFSDAERFNAELAQFTERVASKQPAAPVPPQKPAYFPLSLRQHQAFRDREFALVDRNGDGAIDPAELEFRMIQAVGRSSSAALLRAMRVNCGREVPACSRAAFRKQGDAEFSRVDANRDGTVTEAEFIAAGRTFHLEQPF